MSCKGYLNDEVRALGVQAPAVLAPQPLRRLLHLNPRLCNQPAESTKNPSIRQPFPSFFTGKNHKQLTRAPLDRPVTQMTRPAKGPSARAAAAAAPAPPPAAAPREAAEDEEETDAAEEGL